MIPATGDYVLTNVRIHRSVTDAALGPMDHEGFSLGAVAVKNGRIAAITPRRDALEQAVDLKGRIVLPCFVDCHTHLDKGHTWQRAPNLDGTFMRALETMAADTRNWTKADLARRMEFSLRCAYAHGTRAIRTHLDSGFAGDAISWSLFEELRDGWRGRIELQAACLTDVAMAREPEQLEAMARRMVESKGVLGAFIYPTDDLDGLLLAIFEAAARHSLDLDFHADENGNPDSDALRRIAGIALRTGFEGKVLVGHCCSLAVQPDSEALHTLDEVARAGLSIVSLPMCNLYLQDRRTDRTTPRWRGVTLVHEMRDRGIPVVFASDNTRDAFYPFGDLDMLEVYRMATRTLHLDHPVGAWPRAVTSTPAQIMGLDQVGVLAAGSAADFVIFRGRNWSELLSRPETERIVVRAGKQIDARVPDYAELDDLIGAG